MKLMPSSPPLRLLRRLVELTPPTHPLNTTTRFQPDRTGLLDSKLNRRFIPQGTTTPTRCPTLLHGTEVPHRQTVPLGRTLPHSSPRTFLLFPPTRALAPRRGRLQVYGPMPGLFCNHPTGLPAAPSSPLVQQMRRLLSSRMLNSNDLLRKHLLSCSIPRQRRNLRVVLEVE